jgi:hypothetical protein
VCILYVQWRILSRLALHQCRTCGSGEHDRRRCVELGLERTLRRGAVGVVRAPCVIHGSTELIQTRSARAGVTYGGCATWPNSQSRGATSHIATFCSCIPLSSPICPAPKKRVPHATRPRHLAAGDARSFRSDEAGAVEATPLCRHGCGPKPRRETRWLYQEWCLSGTTHCVV